MHPLTLTDGVLTLRPPRPGDVDAVLQACQDEQVGRWTTVPSPYTRAHAEDWVLRVAPAGWAAGTHLAWYVTDATAGPQDGPLLASVALHHLDLATGDAEVGYWAAPEARGRGVVTDAVRLISRWGFDELGLHRIGWLAGVGNDASLRVAEKVGFRQIGTSRSRLVLGERRVDAWMADLLPGEVTGADRPITATPDPNDETAATVAAPLTPGETDEPWLELRDVEITAGSLHLRPWHGGDVPALVDVMDDPAIALWNPFHRAGSAEQDAERFVARRTTDQSAHVSFAVVDATTGELLGGIAVHHLDRRDGSAEVGYWTVPAARGRGVARQSLGTVTRWAFGALGLERLDLYHASDNDVSCRVAERAGFQQEATLRSSYRYGDGARHDEHLHARLATDPAV